MLSKFFAVTFFITKCYKRSLHTLSWFFWKKLLQSVTNKERFTKIQVSQVLKSETEFITKCNRYHKLWQEVIGKYDRYYEVWQLLQNET